MRDSIIIWLSTFQLDAALHEHAVEVVVALPHDVRIDLMHDESFRISDYEPRGQNHVHVGTPSLNRPARAVSLKRSLREKPGDFIRYVIAHEFAHAFLRNQGRTPHEDPEIAADTLAADWGFPRPEVWPFPLRR
jgi:hypothetical protein